jgi:CheY-like chemotaxis protein
MQTAKIVLIEDNPADVLLVEKALSENGISYALTRFENGTAAVQALCAPQAGDLLPDVILLDLNTPRTDGFEALRQLKQSPRLTTVPLAVLTSSRTRSDKHRAAIQGVRYIEKPSQLREFLAVVGQAVKEMLAAS